jgi:hypothetical protein
MTFKGTIKTVADIKHTEHHWGPVDALANRTLNVLDIERDGSSFLCMNHAVTGLVIVDKRDVVEFIPAPPAPDYVSTLIKIKEKLNARNQDAPK